MKAVKGCVMMMVFVSMAVMISAGCGGGSSNTASTLAMKGTSGNAVNMNGTWMSCKRSDPKQQDELRTATLNGAQITYSNSI